MLAEAPHAPDIAFQIEEMAVNHEVVQSHLYQHKEFGLEKTLPDSHSVFYDQETAIISDPDGTSHVSLKLTPAPQEAERRDDQIIGAPRNSEKPRTAEQQRTALRLLTGDIREATRFYIERAPEGLPILQALGYTLSSDLSRRASSGRTEITLPSTARINQFLDFVRAQTGFAPNAVDYDGGEFKYSDIHERLLEHAFMKSNRLGVREHDGLAHTPAWSIQPEAAMKEIATGSSGMQSQIMRRLDIGIDTSLFTKLVAGDLPEVRKEYAYLLYDQSDIARLPRISKLTVEKLARAAINRTEEIAYCAEEFNALQHAA